MKPKNQHKMFIIMLLLFGTAISKINAQDSTVSTTVLSVTSYFLTKNKIPYLSKYENESGQKI